MISLLLAVRRNLQNLIRILKNESLRALLFMLFFIVVGGIVFFMHTEGMRFTEALYTSVIILLPTSIQVNYTPESTYAEIFMLLYLLSGIGITLTLLLGGVAQFIKKEKLDAEESPEE
ncbi:hypothetical protein [Oceanobacillus sp. CFH 90083]|uniref:hypothetical protein n=1 Tax=Oceanobacillus sp. CFH 90083 TaxID=2592336 RepID=UPI00128E32CA|nr:hypothetical protein [Oceanobacillus sp. CFH 90083]